MIFKKYIPGFLIPKNRKRKQPFSERDCIFQKKIVDLVGIRINDIEVYREAFTFKCYSKRGRYKNFERLEFLGDAVLGSIVSHHLFTVYPDANEGFLTQMKAKVVNRKNLNKLGEKLNLKSYIIQENGNNALGEDILGNLLEALIGAIYLDTDYKTCEECIIKWIFDSQTVTDLENRVVSYKSLLLEWSQKKKVNIRYNTVDQILPNKALLFRSCIFLDNKLITKAIDSSKKKAEEKAAKRAFYTLNKKENILETYKTTS